MKRKLQLSQHQIRAISVAAGCDPRSVVKVLTGQRVRPMTLARIKEAVTAAMTDVASKDPQ